MHREYRAFPVLRTFALASLVVLALLFIVKVVFSGSSAWIALPVVGLLGLVFAGPLLTAKVVVDDEGIEYRSFPFGWRIKWENVSHWSRDTDIEMRPLLRVTAESGKVRTLPSICLDERRLVEVEQQLMSRVPSRSQSIGSTHKKK